MWCVSFGIFSPRLGFWRWSTLPSLESKLRAPTTRLGSASPAEPFKTSELVKIFFIVTFAKHLAVLKERNKLKTFLGVMTLCLHALVPIGLIHFMGDDGTALVFGFMFLIMTFVAGVQLRYYLALIICAGVSIPILLEFCIK